MTSCDGTYAHRCLFTLCAGCVYSHVLSDATTYKIQITKSMHDQNVKLDGIGIKD